MKFRILNQTELQEFEDELKQFLIINGVDHDSWVEINTHDVNKAIELVEIFSDLIFQQVFEKIEFLEHRAKNTLYLFNCKQDSIDLIGLKSDSEFVNFSTTEEIHMSITQHSNLISYFQQTKSYTDNRELELFKMVESGCFVSTQEFYNAMEEAIRK